MLSVRNIFITIYGKRDNDFKHVIFFLDIFKKHILL